MTFLALNLKNYLLGWWHASVVAGSILGQVKNMFLVENLSLYSKELGQDVLRYSNPDRIMAKLG